MVIFRRIDPEADKDFLVELRIVTLFQNETQWARSPDLPTYRRWLLSTRQPEKFLRMLSRSLRDSGTIADIIEVDGVPAGFVWATFVDVRETGFRYLALNELALKPEFQRHGLGRLTQSHIESIAESQQADAIRSFAGAQNTASIAFHKSQGFEVMEYRFEKVLRPRATTDL